MLLSGRFRKGLRTAAYTSIGCPRFRNLPLESCNGFRCAGPSLCYPVAHPLGDVGLQPDNRGGTELDLLWEGAHAYPLIDGAAAQILHSQYFGDT